MPVLYRASLGYLTHHPWQLGLALLGIGIGVAVMVAVDLANTSAQRAFRLSMDTVNGAATHQIVAGPDGVDENLYTRLRVDAGIRDIAPVVQGYVEVDGTTLQLLGVDVFAERGIRSYVLPEDESRVIGDVADRGAAGSIGAIRRLLTEPGAVFMSGATAAQLGLDPDRRMTVISDGKRYPAVLAGTIRDGSPRRLDDLIIADISVAQHWLGMRGRLSRIDVREPDDSDGALGASIRALLPPDAQLLETARRTRTVTELSSAFTTNLTAMSLLALLVGVFLIYNSVGFAVLQRRGLIGILRAHGVTRGQTFRLILAEGLALGLVGAVLGVVLGIWLGDQLLVLVSRSINDLYFRVNVTDVAVSPASVARGLSAGLLATLVAVAVPALEAAAYAPRLATVRSILERRAGGMLPKIALAGIVAALSSLLLLALSGDNLVAGLSAVFLMIVGVSLCIPLAVRPLTAIVAPLAGRLGGVGGRLAVAGIGATLSRTGVAIVALAVAVSATIGVGIMVDSFRASVSEWLGNTLRSDIYVGVARGSLDPTLLEDMVAIDAVLAYSTSRRAWIEGESGRTRIIALRMAPGSYAGTRILDGDADPAWDAFDEAGAVIVSEPYAYRKNLSRGDRLTLDTANGPQEFVIAGVYQSYDANAGAVLMSRDTYDRHWRDRGVDSIGLYLADPGESERVAAELRRLSAGRQAIVVRSNRELVDRSMQIFDRTFVITDVLYWLAVGVAVIGILGAMLALQLERLRELAVLRSVGMTPAALGGMVTLQSGVIGFLSGLAAIPLGLLMAWLLIDVINRRAFGWRMDIEVPVSVLAEALLLAVGAAVVAGLYPAWRAARTRIALAMREE